jgi:hypothetical protein
MRAVPHNVDNDRVTTPYGPPQGSYPAGPPPAMGRLVVDTSYHPMAFILGLTGPKVAINGYPTNVAWGQAPFDLPAGNYHLYVSTRYLGDLGPATLQVAVHPGQLTTVFYRPPAAIGMSGSLGFEPQKTRGMGVMMALNIVAILLVIVLLVASL